MKLTYIAFNKILLVILSLALFTILGCKEDVVEKEAVIPEAKLLNQSGYIYEDIKIELIQDEENQLSAIFLEESDNQFSTKRRLPDYTRDGEFISFRIPDITEIKKAARINIILEFENNYEIILEWSIRKPELISVDKNILGQRDTLTLKIRGVTENGNFYYHDGSEEIETYSCFTCARLTKEIINDSTVRLINNTASYEFIFSKIYLIYEEDEVLHYFDEELTYTASYSIEEFPNPESVTYGAGISLDLGLNYNAITNNISVFIGEQPMRYLFYYLGTAAYEFPLNGNNIGDSSLTVYYNEVPLIPESKTKMNLQNSYFTLSFYEIMANQNITLKAELDHVFYQRNEKLHFRNTISNDIFISESKSASVQSGGQRMLLDFDIPEEVRTNLGNYEIYITAGSQGRQITERDNKIFTVE